MIDLRLTLHDFDKTLNEKVISRRQDSKYQSLNPNNEIKLTFQFLKSYDSERKNPMTFYIYRSDIQVNCFLKNVEAKFGLSTSENFYYKFQEVESIIQKFIAFLYCGKLRLSREELFTYIKLGIHFECKELVIELLKNYTSFNLEKSCFIHFLVYFFNSKFFGQLDNTHTREMIEDILLANTETLINHQKYDIPRIDLIVGGIIIYNLGIQKMTYQIFLQFSTIYLKHNKIKELTHLVYFLQDYGNPQALDMEKQYIQMLINVIDENIFLEIRNKLTDLAKSAFENHLKDKVYTTICHFIHTKVCDITNKQFVAHCGHKICLNCFFEYFLYKTIKIDEQQPSYQEKYKFKCLSRYIDDQICGEVLNSQDFQQLIPYFGDEIHQYLH